MVSVDFTTLTIGGIGAPKFVYWYNNGIDYRIRDSVTLTVPTGTPEIRFIPNQIVYTDINNMERVIHLGWNVEFEFTYTYLNLLGMQKLIKVFSWLPSDLDQMKIQCFPHIDFQFNFFGRFDSPLPFSGIADKFLGHSCRLLFRSTELVQAVPNTSSNKVIQRRLF